MSGYRVAGGWDRPERWVTEVKPDPGGSRKQRRLARRRGITQRPIIQSGPSTAPDDVADVSSTCRVEPA